MQQPGKTGRGEHEAALPEPPASPQQHHNWTDDLPDTDHVRFFKETDWANSKLGPIEGWSSTLRLLTRMVFADSRSACLWWGPDMVAIYNETYKYRAGIYHPKLMGSAFRDGYPPEMWESLQPYFEDARRKGVASEFPRKNPLILDRHGWPEETYWTASFVPVGEGPTNQPQGFYNSLFEVTGMRITERRTAMLNRMAAAQDLTASTVWPLVLASLESNPCDIPMALLYEADEVVDTQTLHLRGQLGFPDGHQLLVDNVDIYSPDGIIPDCRRASDGQMRLLEYDERFSNISWRGHGAPSHRIAVLPISGHNRVFGYLIVGTNPYRPFDQDTHQFLSDLLRMITTVVETAVRSQESQRRQSELELDLEESDLKLRHLVEHSAVGMVHMSKDGEYIWANDRFFELHGLTQQDPKGKLEFFEVYADEDRGKAERAWEDLQAGANHVNIELRLKRFYTTPLGNQVPAHIQVLAFPYMEHGQTKGIMAATTDISHYKWAQNFQARLAAEAREAKRQQEAFIDVVSHEMRNPLSAIMHCADEISKSLEECRSCNQDIPDYCVSALTENVNAAQIILQCVNHQKRIIDDVLTLSRLDSMLLSITPTSTDPTKLISTIIGLFEAELKSNRITYHTFPDASLTQLHIANLYLDPSRVTQIFINLITNAIKFVKNSDEPTISIYYGATTKEPRKFFSPDMFWASNEEETQDTTQSPEWGDGETIYLTFIVQDTGIGLSDDEIHKIFSRFKQANMRTHVKYGGSGLGLFISKELTEKQGGEIGVTASPGKGSTFGFYIRTKRVAEPTKKRVDSHHSLEGGSSARLHVLLVEDNIVNQQVLVRQLKKAGLFVDVANQGLEALSILEHKVFDVVLMDLEMPVMDGLTAMREIRKRQRQNKITEHLPIIAVTANVRKEQIDTAVAAGADAVMQKPFKAVELVHMMKGLVPQVKTPSSEPTTPGLIGPLNGLLM